MKLQKPLIIVAACFIALGMGGSFVGNIAQTITINTLARNSDALRQQVTSLGHKPVAPPSESVTGSPGQPGATGPQGPRGLPGDTGTPGASGAPGPQGVPGPTGANGIDGFLGPIGSPGMAGPPGPSGPAGADGAPGASGAQGPPGDTGSPGTGGPPGSDGSAGQPPSSWTYTDALGVSYTCTRTDPFDPTTPTYTCSADPTPTDPPTEGATP